MITEKVQSLFEFINFLHTNTDYFLSKRPIIDKVLALSEKRRALNPNNNYKDKIEYDKIQAEIKKVFDEAEKQTTNVIKDKIQVLDIADVSTPIINLNAKAELFELQRNFSEEDLIIIHETRRKYVDFRTKTNSHYFLQFFFDELDRDLKQFFNYFKDESVDYFEPFERKSVTVNSIADAIKHFQDGKAVSLPLEAFNQQHTAEDEFQNLKKYIRDNYLNIHPNNFTLERLEQIRRNISKWKLQLKDLNKAPELQEFISETIENIDSQIERYSLKQSSETGKPELLETINKEKGRRFIANEYALAYILGLYANGKQIPQNRVEGCFDAKEIKKTGEDLGFEKPDTFYRAVMNVAKYDLNKKEHLEAISKDWLGAVKTLNKDWNAVSKYLEEKQLFKE